MAWRIKRYALGGRPHKGPIDRGGASLKEIVLSSRFSRFFLLGLPRPRTYLLRRSPWLLFERLRHDSRAVRLRQSDELVGGSFKVYSSGPVAVVLVFATAPQFIPSCIRLPYGKRSGRLVSGCLTPYCSVRPSCETQLVPIRPTSPWDRSRGIYAPPRTEQGPQGSWHLPQSMQSPWSRLSSALGYQRFTHGTSMPNN
jgi:hypothetical protein